MGSRSDDPHALPDQASPPAFATSDLRPHALGGVEVLALPVLPGEQDGAQDGWAATPVLGPGAAEVADQLGTDLLALLEHGAPPAVRER